MLAGVPLLDFLPLVCSELRPGDLWAGHRAKTCGSWNFGFWFAPEVGTFIQTHAFVGVENTEVAKSSSGDNSAEWGGDILIETYANGKLGAGTHAMFRT